MIGRLTERVFGSIRGGRGDSGTSDECAERLVDGEGSFFDGASSYEYAHYLDALDDVAELERAGERAAAERLLRWCLDYAEAEQGTVADGPGWGDLPAEPYRRLADLYRDDGRADAERDVLKRYVSGQAELGAPVEPEIEARLDGLRERVESDD